MSTNEATQWTANHSTVCTADRSTVCTANYATIKPTKWFTNCAANISAIWTAYSRAQRSTHCTTDF